MIKLKNYKRPSTGGAGGASSSSSTATDGAVSSSPSASSSSKRVPVRDKLLIKEVEELERTIPSYVSVKFDNPDRLYDLRLVISPEEGDWMGGHFRFHVLTVLKEKVFTQCHPRYHG